MECCGSIQVVSWIGLSTTPVAVCHVVWASEPNWVPSTEDAGAPTFSSSSATAPAVVEPVGRRLREGACDDLLILARHPCVVRYGSGRSVDDRVENLDVRLPGERRLPGRHLVEDGSRREDVGPRVDGRALRLLRGHVARRSHHGALAGQRHRLGRVSALRLLKQLGETEVEYLDQAVRPDDDVLGLDVAVHDAQLVGLAERAGYLSREVEYLVERRDAGGHPVAQRPSLDEFHGDERRPVDLVDLVDGGDVGMVDGGRGLSLADEALDPLVVGRDVLRQDLERDLPAELRVLGGVDDAHAAAAELVDDPVVRDSLVDHAAPCPQWVRIRRGGGRWTTVTVA